MFSVIIKGYVWNGEDLDWILILCLDQNHVIDKLYKNIWIKFYLFISISGNAHLTSKKQIKRET